MLSAIDVIPGKRFWHFNFGINYSEIVRSLGKPTCQETDEENLFKVTYEGIRTDFFFAHDELLAVSSSFAGLKIFGSPLIGHDLSKLIELFVRNGIPVSVNSEIEKPVVTFDNAGCVFELERGIVISGSFCPIDKN